MSSESLSASSPVQSLQNRNLSTGTKELDSPYCDLPILVSNVNSASPKDNNILSVHPQVARVRRSESIDIETLANADRFLFQTTKVMPPSPLSQSARSSPQRPLSIRSQYRSYEASSPTVVDESCSDSPLSHGTAVLTLALNSKDGSSTPNPCNPNISTIMDNSGSKVSAFQEHLRTSDGNIIDRVEDSPIPIVPKLKRMRSADRDHTSVNSPMVFPSFSPQPHHFSPHVSNGSSHNTSAQMLGLKNNPQFDTSRHSVFSFSLPALRSREGSIDIERASNSSVPSSQVLQSLLLSQIYNSNPAEIRSND